jgi:hypothetical protein
MIDELKFLEWIKLLFLRTSEILKTVGNFLTNCPSGGPQTGRKRISDSAPDRSNKLFLPRSFQTSLKAHPVSYLIGTVGNF